MNKSGGVYVGLIFHYKGVSGTHLVCVAASLARLVAGVAQVIALGTINTVIATRIILWGNNIEVDLVRDNVFFGCFLTF